MYQSCNIPGSCLASIKIVEAIYETMDLKIIQIVRNNNDCIQKFPKLPCYWTKPRRDCS